MPNYIDITGYRFGRLTVVAAQRSDRTGVHWFCQCNCGGAITVYGGHLRNGNTRSCGCLKREMLANGSGHVRHREAAHDKRTREYEAWASMRERCRNQQTKAYKYYGGRGIKICKRWEKFENFLADMGRRPPGYSIERINVNGNYTPNNCVWIPRGDQSKNRRPWTWSKTRRPRSKTGRH